MIGFCYFSLHTSVSSLQSTGFFLVPYRQSLALPQDLCTCCAPPPGCSSPRYSQGCHAHFKCQHLKRSFLSKQQLRSYRLALLPWTECLCPLKIHAEILTLNVMVFRGGRRLGPESEALMNGVSVSRKRQKSFLSPGVPLAFCSLPCEGSHL